MYVLLICFVTYICACTGILGEINDFANSTRGNTTVGAAGGARVGDQSPPPPLKKLRKL